MNPNSNTPGAQAAQSQEIPLVLCLKAIAEVIQRNDPCLVINTPPSQNLSNEELSQRVAYALREVCGQNETFGRFSAAELATANIPPYLEWLRHRLLSGSVAQECWPAGFKASVTKAKKAAEVQHPKRNGESSRSAHGEKAVDPMVAAMNKLDLHGSRGLPTYHQPPLPHAVPIMYPAMAPHARGKGPAMPHCHTTPRSGVPTPVASHASLGQPSPASAEECQNHIRKLEAAAVARWQQEQSAFSALFKTEVGRGRTRESRHTSDGASSSRTKHSIHRSETQGLYSCAGDAQQDNGGSSSRAVSSIRRPIGQQSATAVGATEEAQACVNNPPDVEPPPPYRKTTVDDDEWSDVEREEPLEWDEPWELLDAPAMDDDAADEEIDDSGIHMA